MKNLLLLATLFLFSIAQAQVNVNWFNYPGGVAVAADTADNIYTANWDYNAAGDITLTKRNSSGNILWETAFNNTDNTKHEVATWVATDRAGDIVVSGTIRSGYSNPVNAASVLMKFNSAGTLLWRVIYEGSFDGSSTTKCLIDAANNIFVLGIGTGPNGQVTKVKKFNTAGVSQWNYYDAGIGAPVNFKFTPDSNILIIHRGITGSINGFSKINLNGNNIWSLAGFNSLSVGDASGDAFGNTYLVNGDNVTGGSTIKKISPAAAVIWSKINAIKGNRVEVGTDQKPVVSGYPMAGYGAAFIKYDTSGNMLWQNLDADGPSVALLAHAQLKLDAYNAAYVAGSTMSQMGVCKVNSDGSSAWTATTSSGYPVSFVFGTDNSVYVTGGTTARFNQSGVVAVPAAPTNLTAIVAGTSVINLTWTDNANNETNYLLQRSLFLDSGFTTIVTLPANATAYSNTGLNSSTTYYYRVQAINNTSSSQFSNVVSATTNALLPPAAPGSLRVTATGCNFITLNWIDNSSNESGFELKRSVNSFGNFVTIATMPANSTSYTNTGLVNGRKYYYQIRAVNTSGNSLFSNKISGKSCCHILVQTGDNYKKKTYELKGIQVFPNPAYNGMITISLPADTQFPVSVALYAMDGKLVLKSALSEIHTTIKTGGLTNGMYLMSVWNKQDLQTVKVRLCN